MLQQIPTGLKRTAPMYKSRQRKSTDASISGKERPAMPSLGSQKVSTSISLCQSIVVGL